MIIEVVVSPKGETKIETKGFTGAECQKASRFLERALGKTVTERPTAEFHQVDPSRHRTTEQA